MLQPYCHYLVASRRCCVLSGHLCWGLRVQAFWSQYKAHSSILLLERHAGGRILEPHLSLTWQAALTVPILVFLLVLSLTHKHMQHLHSYFIHTTFINLIQFKVSRLKCKMYLPSSHDLWSNQDLFLLKQVFVTFVNYLLHTGVWITVQVCKG